MAVLAVVPSDPMSAYEAKGTHVWCERYYNPGGFFDDVYLFSPREKLAVFQYGMYTVPTPPQELRKHVRKYGVDIVRAYGGYWPCDFVCGSKVPGVPVVVSVHDTNPAELYDSIRNADYVFCMSRSVRDLVLTKHPNPRGIWILPNRFDGAVMRPMPDADFSDLNAQYPWRRRLLCVGRLSKQKNQDTLIRALKHLGPDYGCLFVGRNDPAALQRLARECGVAAQCRFVESVRNDVLPRYYNWADAMVTPSRWEGFGVVFIEALASGGLVVTSNVGPMSEYITHEKNGLLVNACEDPAALSLMVRRACEDKDLARQLRASAPASVEQFERRKVDEVEAEYYKRILSETRSRRPRRPTARPKHDHLAHSLISIVLPTHNGARYLQDAIDGCLSQTWTNLELILMDDGSTDPAVRAIFDRQKDSRVIQLRLDKNVGLPQALNSGFARAHGSLLTWTSDDNRFRPNALEVMAKALMHTGADFVYARASAVDATGHVTGSIVPKPPDQLAMDNCVGPCFLYRREVRQEIGDYDPNLPLTEDYDYWIRVSRRFRMVPLGENLYLYRRHPGTLTSVQGRLRVDEMIEKTRRKHFKEAEILAAEGLKAFGRDDYAAAAPLLGAALKRTPFRADLYRPAAICLLPASIVEVIVRLKALLRRRGS